MIPVQVVLFVVIVLLTLFTLALVVLVIESEARAEGHAQPWQDNSDWTEEP